MTKEQIMDEHNNAGEYPEWHEKNVYNAMDEYARQEAIAFHRWSYENNYAKYWGSDQPNNNKWYKSYTMPNRTYYTDKELYQLFKQQPHIN